LVGVIAHFAGSLIVVFAILDYFSHQPLIVVIILVSGIIQFGNGETRVVLDDLVESSEGPREVVFEGVEDVGTEGVQGVSGFALGAHPSAGGFIAVLHGDGDAVEGGGVPVVFLLATLSVLFIIGPGSIASTGFLDALVEEVVELFFSGATELLSIVQIDGSLQRSVVVGTLGASIGVVVGNASGDGDGFADSVGLVASGLATNGGLQVVLFW